MCIDFPSPIMDNLFLKKLPPELFLKIYETVFHKDMGGSSYYFPEVEITVTRAGSFTYSFSRGCGLTFACRLIKAESWATMWRNAIVRAYGRGFGWLGNDDAIEIGELNKVLPDEIAQNIIYLSNIHFPSRQHLSAQVPTAQNLLSCGVLLQPWDRRLRWNTQTREHR